MSQAQHTASRMDSL